MDLLHEILGRSSDSITWAQMSARALVIGFYGLFLFRLIPRRALGGVTVIDMVFTVIIGSSLSRSLTGNAPIVPVLAASTVLVALHFFLSGITPHSKVLSWLVKGRPILLIDDGSADWNKIRRYHLGPHDIEESLRLNGISRIEEVKEARLERNGAVSVIRK